MFVCEILHVYTDGHFVVVVLVNNKKFDFNPIVNFEIVSKMFEMYENINKSNFIANYPKGNAYRTICFPCHIEKNRMASLPCP